MRRLLSHLLLLVVLAAALSVTRATAQEITPAGADLAGAADTSFTFQGMLSDASGPVSNLCNLKFALYDSANGGNRIGSEIIRNGQSVVGGQFTVQLDFGAVFDGRPRWLDVAVRCPASPGPLTVLAPRQKVGWVPYAQVAGKLIGNGSAAGDFTASGYLRSARGVANDNVTGALELVNTISGNRWHVSVTRTQDELLIGLIDAASRWHHAASFYRNGDAMLVGNLYLNGVVTNTLETRGVLRSVRGRADDTSTGTVELVNTFSNGKWHITSNRDTDQLQFWFAENGTNWRHAATMETNGNFTVNNKLQVAGNAFTFATSPAGIQWQNTGASLGHAGGAGEYSVNAGPGDLVLRAADAKRLLLGRGNAAANFPAALTVEPTGLVAIPNLQTGGLVEANLMTEAERAAPRIERFSQGDLLCWSAAAERLELCAEAASPLVVAVANVDGKPLVAGVEPLRVVGPVAPGELLVAAGMPGYAAAWSQLGTGAPPPGVVIAKGLATCAEPTCILKAMILAR